MACLPEAACGPGLGTAAVLGGSVAASLARLYAQEQPQPPTISITRAVVTDTPPSSTTVTTSAAAGPCGGQPTSTPADAWIACSLGAARRLRAPHGSRVLVRSAARPAVAQLLVLACRSGGSSDDGSGEPQPGEDGTAWLSPMLAFNLGLPYALQPFLSPANVSTQAGGDGSGQERLAGVCVSLAQTLTVQPLLLLAPHEGVAQSVQLCKVGVPKTSSLAAAPAQPQPQTPPQAGAQAPGDAAGAVPEASTTPRSGAVGPAAEDAAAAATALQDDMAAALQAYFMAERGRCPGGGGGG